MAARRPRNREARIAFDSLSIEGALLSPDWLTQLAQLGAVEQSESDYRIPKGLNLRDEIGRYWRVAQAHWRDFDAGLARNTDPEALSRSFVPSLLREVFGFASLAAVETVEREGRRFPLGHAALGLKVPVVIAPANSGLDTLTPRFGEDGKRRSAFGLVQEFLNATDEALWGLACDGVSLRLVRDNASLTRPAWIEADLARIFREERYADFAALWLLVHESRFGTADRAPSKCALERWRTDGREAGTAAGKELRVNVRQALLDLGQGFLSHPENTALRTALDDGSLSLDAYFQQLLRLCYRLIFLLTAEERDVLHPSSTGARTRERYAEGYSLRHLRERSTRRSNRDRFSDHWESLRIVLRAMAKGEPRLGLPALGGLFATTQCADLDASKLENRALLAAVFHLSWLREATGLSRVNWRDMGPEELGSVYESLLELVPQRAQQGRVFSFAMGDETRGNARKTSGSYYTPDSLVQVLLDSALDPVMRDTIAAHPENPVEALLSLSIVDPACGSGHFLLAAARRLAAQVARLEANGTPSAAQYRHALRQVVSRCIYGVDLNPMALELCRVSLWMEAVEPGLPLSFLESHLQHGNALLGATPEFLAKGIPDAAWEPIEGDDKKVASALKKRNKLGAKGQGSLVGHWSATAANDGTELTNAVEALDRTADDALDAVDAKSRTWDEIRASAAFRRQKFAADAWCAAFVWPKVAGEAAESAPTNDLWIAIRSGHGTVPEKTRKTVETLTAQYRFLHWHLAFPQVFKRGGFDVVLGNPPWDQIEIDPTIVLKDQPQILSAPNQAARERAIDRLEVDDHKAFLRWSAAKRETEGLQHFLHASASLPLSSYGRLNTAPCFTELSIELIRHEGRVGIVVPTSVVSEAFNQKLFRYLVESKSILSLYDFENTAGANLFPGVGHRRFKLCLLSLGKGIEQDGFDVVFFAHHVNDLHNSSMRYRLTTRDIELVNPNTWTCPAFRSARDASISLTTHRNFRALKREQRENDWNISGLLMFMMGGASDKFLTASSDTAFPLVEAKMIHHFDHRYGDYADRPTGSENTSLPSVPESRLLDPGYVPNPRYWLERNQIEERLAGKWTRNWFLVWRDVCRSGDERTLISTVIPRYAVAHTLPVACLDHDPKIVANFHGMLASFVTDYLVRQKLGGTHMTYAYLYQLPVLAPKTFEADTQWQRGTALRNWILPRVLELTYTAWDLEAFGRDVGYDGPPFRWDPARRAHLRAELDAAFFHLYGIGRNDVDYVMETFPIVRRNDEKAHGEFRTKRLILEAYDAMEKAAKTGIAYVTTLDPPPADARVAHPDIRTESRKSDQTRSGS